MRLNSCSVDKYHPDLVFESLVISLLSPDHLRQACFDHLCRHLSNPKYMDYVRSNIIKIKKEAKNTFFLEFLDFSGGGKTKLLYYSSAILASPVRRPPPITLEGQLWPWLEALTRTLFDTSPMTP